MVDDSARSATSPSAPTTTAASCAASAGPTFHVGPAEAGFTNVELHHADARCLPFAHSSFDVVFSSYLLDVIPLGDIPLVVGEFRRVLRDNGRLVLVNTSRDRGMTRWEKLYRATPTRLVPYLYGGCRPVLMAQPVAAAGMRDVRREFIAKVIPSEVVIGS